MALKRMGFHGRVSAHGFRRLALTNIQKHLKIDMKTMDHQLAKINKNAAYNWADDWDERIEMRRNGQA